MGGGGVGGSGRPRTPLGRACFSPAASTTSVDAAAGSAGLARTLGSRERKTEALASMHVATFSIMVASASVTLVISSRLRLCLTLSAFALHEDSPVSLSLNRGLEARWRPVRFNYEKPLAVSRILNMISVQFTCAHSTWFSASNHKKMLRQHYDTRPEKLAFGEINPQNPNADTA